MSRRMYDDVETLAGLDRRTAGLGEHASARHLVKRLCALGAKDVVTPRFRTQASWAPPHLAHVAMGAAAAATDGPVARIAAGIIATSYELEVSGRSQWVRRLLPAQQGISVVGRIPARGESLRTLVLVAHHDAAQTGLVWHRLAVAASQWHSSRTGNAIPSHLPALAALAAGTLPARRVRRAAVGALGVTAALMVQALRSKTTPGANDNASGVAALLEVARRLIRDPLPDTSVLLVFPGGEEAGNSGIKDWVKRNRGQLDPANSLVINLDAVGSAGTLAVARRESLTNPIGKSEVNRARRSAEELGFELKAVAIPNPTDAVITARAGLPTISLLSDEDGWISHLHRASDTPDNVGWGTVARAVTLVEHISRTWSREATQ